MSMNYRNADLNLLKVFEALMIEGNVTRTAHKLSLTQPTVSNALRRLRDTYDDPLFVRSGAGVHPTRRALELWSPLSRSLHAIRSAIEGETFAPLRTNEVLRISMSGQGAAPEVLQRLVLGRSVSPGRFATAACLVVTRLSA